ncbi:MAG TPA: condensation domain-containing protein [Candidatus Kapabacteria bacterium]|nr:condensation domain-containing protein [Candidatus Kapabacteria bacterium]
MNAELSTAERIARILQSSGMVEDCAVVHPGEAPAGGGSRCSVCGITSAFPNITFNRAGVCSLCQRYSRNRERVRTYFRELHELEALFERAKPARRSRYDCLLLYSGGKDSTYALYSLVAMGLTVATFTFDNGFISAKALDNIDRITSELGVDHTTMKLGTMRQVFRESLARNSTVCNGCFKALLDLSLQFADEQEIGYVVTGLSRGQIIDERLGWFYERNIYDPDEIDRQLAVGRKVYHRIEDYEGLRLQGIASDTIFDRVRMIDFYRYTSVTKKEIFQFLRRKADSWNHPTDCGFCSSNCMINDVGVHVHQKERGYHNYESPTAWDVRLGFLSLEEAREELHEVANVDRVVKILNVLDYRPAERATSAHRSLIAYCIPAAGATTEQIVSAAAAFDPAMHDSLDVVFVDEISRDAAGNPDIERLLQRHSERPLHTPEPIRPAGKQRTLGLEQGSLPFFPGQYEVGVGTGVDSEPACITLGLEMPPASEPEMIRKAALHLYLHHDALRLQFRRDNSGWSQQFRPVGSGLSFSAADISAQPEARHAAIVTMATERLRRSLDPENGPAVGFAYLHRGDDLRGILLIAMLRLAVDQGSLPILIADLETALDQLRNGGVVTLPPKTASLKALGEYLQTYALSDSTANDEAYWMRMASGDPEQPAGTIDEADGREANGSRPERSVIELTRRLGSEGDARDGGADARLHASMLAAIARGLAVDTGPGGLLVDLTLAGNRPGIGGLALSRMVGPIDTCHPFRLHLHPAAAAETDVSDLLERLHAVPDGGFGHAALRYLRAGTPLRHMPRPATRITLMASSFGTAGTVTATSVWTPPDDRYDLDVAVMVLTGTLYARARFRHDRYNREALAGMLATTADVVASALAGGSPPLE